MAERLDVFMGRANAAYYATRNPFADFATSPEISQAFGEILGAWAATVWQELKQPDPVILAELGPGHGTLMADALRLIARVAPAFRAALRLHLVETSPRLRAVQATRLPGGCWHADLASLPDGPLILLANEFLDALPIRQFVRQKEGWAERHVGAAAWVEEPAVPLGLDAAEGEIVEVCEPAQMLGAALGARLLRQPGRALFLDYGRTTSSPGDTLQALRHGRPAPPLHFPGEADLTAHVDFDAFARAARAGGAVTHGPVPQAVLLTRLGLLQRTERLATAQPNRAATLRAAASRLVASDAMGELFQAMAVSHPDLPVPPGFEP